MRILAALLTACALAGPAAAEPATTDPDRARLQAEEAAIRAGANRPHPVEIQRFPKLSASTDAGVNARINQPTGAHELRMPLRTEARPSGAALQALLAAGNGPAAPAAAAKSPTKDDEATAEGLAALETFRRSHGLAH